MMEFYEGGSDDRFESVHNVYTVSGDNKHLITLTGAVRIDLQGKSTKEWRSEDITIYPRIGPFLQDKALKVEQWAPFVTINTLYNANQAVDAGWGVNNFWLEFDHIDQIIPGPPPFFLKIKSRVLVRDVDGWLFRIAYQVTLVGQLVDWKWEYP
jgi:hypothetical protein